MYTHLYLGAALGLFKDTSYQRLLVCDRERVCVRERSCVGVGVWVLVYVDGKMSCVCVDGKMSCACVDGKMSCVCVHGKMSWPCGRYDVSQDM